MKLFSAGSLSAIIVAMFSNAALAHSPNQVTVPETLADVRDPAGPVTAEDLARGTIEVEGEPVDDNELVIFGMLDRFELRSGEGEGEEGYLFDGFGYIGGDYNRLWLEVEGEGKLDGDLEAAQLQVLYSRAITPYWNLQFGLRRDFKPDPSLSYAVIGAEGLDFYWSQIEADLYVSEDGDVSSSVEIQYSEFLTQRLVIEPRFAFNAQAQDVPDLDLGSGITDYEIGVRMRYEFTREFAPYVGVSWTETVGGTADLLPPSEDAGVFSVVAGVRFWF